MKRLAPLILLLLTPPAAWAGGCNIPDYIYVGYEFGIDYQAEARDGSGPVAGGTMNYALGLCGSSGCDWWNGVDYTGATPTWGAMQDIDSLGATYGHYMAFHTPLAAAAGKYLKALCRDTAGQTSTNAVGPLSDSALVRSEDPMVTSDVGNQVESSLESAVPATPPAGSRDWHIRRIR